MFLCGRVCWHERREDKEYTKAKELFPIKVLQRQKSSTVEEITEVEDAVQTYI